jgi:hypothetical protein
MLPACRTVVVTIAVGAATGEPPLDRPTTRPRLRILLAAVAGREVTRVGTFDPGQKHTTRDA